MTSSKAERLDLGNGKHNPLIPRVDWRPVAEFVTQTGRKPQHCGRPSMEQVPIFCSLPLRRLGAFEPGGILYQAKVVHGDLSVVAAIKANADLRQATIAWEHPPDIGRPLVHRMMINFLTDMVPLGQRFYWECPHCQTRCFAGLGPDDDGLPEWADVIQASSRRSGVAKAGKLAMANCS